MDDKAVEEAARLGLLERLQVTQPSSARELASSLGISERVVGGLLERLVAQGVAEEATSSTSSEGSVHVYRLAQRRRARSGNAAAQPRPGRTGSFPSPNAAQQGLQQQQQPPYMTGMVAYGYAPFPGPQVVYYPAGMPPFPQQSAGGGAAPWPHHGQRPQMLQQAGSGGMPGVPGQQMVGYPFPAYWYAPAGAAPPQMAPSHPRQAGLPREGSGSSASGGSTGWGGVPLSQLGDAARPGSLHSPASQRSVRSTQEPPPMRLNAASSGPTAEAQGMHGAIAEGTARRVLPGPSAAEPAGGAAANGSEAGSEAGDGAPLGASPTSAGTSASGSTVGGEGKGEGAHRAGGSTGGSSSGGSRRSRGSRERQPCAFFLKTGTCAYGDSCKFAHPFDRAPRVEFNSLGLPLRPGEPECSFYMKNFRCAFGHTCKFHHPEPAGPVGTPPQPLFAVPFGMPFQQQGSPGVGVKPRPGVPPPPLPAGMHMAAFMAPPFPGAPPSFPGRSPAMPPSYPATPTAPPPGPVHAAPAKPGSSKAAQPPAPAPPAAGAPMPIPLPAATAAELAAPGRLQGDPRAGDQTAATDVSAGPGDGGVAAAASARVSAPQPIMVFNSQQAAAVASALEQMDLQSGGPSPVQQEQLSTASPSPPGGGSDADGVTGPLQHSPRQRADVLAAA